MALKRDKAGFTFGNPGMHHAFGIIAAHQEEIPGKRPRITYYLRKAIAWSFDTPLGQIGEEIRGLTLSFDPRFYTTPFSEFLIDQPKESEPVTQLRKHLKGTGVYVKLAPIVEQAA